jgi:dTDP-glucose pyrophosphorylase
MIAIIPMMGLGSRFREKGYTEYKPFVKINTEPLLRKVVNPLIGKFDDIYIICDLETEPQVNFLFGEMVKCIVLNSPTGGAAETLLLATEYLPDNVGLVCIDCDIIIDESVIGSIHTYPPNCILSFEDNDMLGIYSYMSIDEIGNIRKIREKEAISNVANAGVYMFESKKLLSFACEHICKDEGESYLSKVVQYLIDYGYPFSTIDITGKYQCCGTPYQLIDYSKKTMNPHIICFDIDGTLIYDLYETPKAIVKNVLFCNEAYRRGHKIILHTARGMVSKNGDPIRIESQRPYVEKVLDDNGVLYHELIFMKPYADIYIDDKAVSAHRNLEKETGLYLFEDHKSRVHNKILTEGNIIHKYGDLKAESDYYKRLPQELIQLFPTIHKNSDTHIIMERIFQPTYSSLLLSQRLGFSDINNLVSSLDIIHSMSMTSTIDLDLSWIYTDKVLSRFNTHPDVYKNLGLDIGDFLQIINSPMEYKLGVIHGDPVFTNVFFSSNGICKFIDPRGKWAAEYTLLGDIYYDYAKILQSLYGYDYILHGEHIPHSYLKKMRDYFISKINEIDTINTDDLILRVKLLIISLLPLHSEDTVRCKNFIKLLSYIDGGYDETIVKY